MLSYAQNVIRFSCEMLYSEDANLQVVVRRGALTCSLSVQCVTRCGKLVLFTCAV